MDKAIDSMAAPGFGKFLRSTKSRFVISPSFFGFDHATHIQPNLLLTGPIMSADTSGLRERLERQNGDLAEWMNAALAANEPIIYITLGSEVHWQ